MLFLRTGTGHFPSQHQQLQLEEEGRYNLPSWWLLCFHWSTNHDSVQKKTQPSAQPSISLWRNMNHKCECTLRMCEAGSNIARYSIHPSDGSWHLRSLEQIFENRWYLCNAFTWTSQRCFTNALWDSCHGIFCIILSIVYNKLVSKWCDYQVAVYQGPRLMGSQSPFSNWTSMDPNLYTGESQQRKLQSLLFCGLLESPSWTNPCHLMNSCISKPNSKWYTFFIFQKTFVFPVGDPWSLVILWRSRAFCLPFLGWNVPYNAEFPIKSLIWNWSY